MICFEKSFYTCVFPSPLIVSLGFFPLNLFTYSAKNSDIAELWQSQISPQLELAHLVSFGALVQDITFIPVKLHLFGVSVTFQTVEGILYFTLAYYCIKYPSQLYVGKSDKCSSYVHFDAINKNIEQCRIQGQSPVAFNQWSPCRL